MIITILNILILFIAPFILLGLLKKTKAFWSGRKGVSILQPLWDFLRLMKKDAVYSKTTSWVFRFAPIVTFASVIFASLFVPLANGQAIEKPTYDYVNHTRAKETETIAPCDVIVLEGLFVLEDETLRSRLDMKIFVDTDADIRFIRRLKRDVRDRGRTLESVVEQYTQTVRVMHNLFIEPSRRHADIIIPEGGHNVVAIDLLVTKISSIIESNVL